MNFFSCVETENLHKESRAFLDEGDYRFLSEAFARITRNARLGDRIRRYLIAAKADLSGRGPFRFEEGTPRVTEGHAFICGMPRTGKTMLTNIEIVRMAKEKWLREGGHQTAPEIIVVVDTEGDRAPYIITELEKAGMGDRWLYFDHETIKENLFEFSQYDSGWFGRIAQAMAEMGYFGDTGPGFLRESAIRAHSPEEMQKRGGYATYDEYVEYVASMKTARGSKLERYRETAYERLRYMQPSVSPIFGCRQGYDWKQLMNKVVIYDIRGLDLDAQLLFQNYMLVKLLFLCERFGIKAVYDLDEMHKFIQSLAQKGIMFEPIVIEVGRTSQKRGMRIIFKDQFFSTPPKELVGTCSTVVSFLMRDQDCLRKADRGAQSEF